MDEVVLGSADTYLHTGQIAHLAENTLTVVLALIEQVVPRSGGPRSITKLTPAVLGQFLGGSHVYPSLAVSRYEGALKNRRVSCGLFSR